MLFPSIETGTAMNAHESENYLPISVFPKVENPCHDKNSGQFSFCTMQHTCITPQCLQNTKG